MKCEKNSVLSAAHFKTQLVQREYIIFAVFLILAWRPESLTKTNLGLNWSLYERITPLSWSVCVCTTVCRVEKDSQMSHQLIFSSVAGRKLCKKHTLSVHFKQETRKCGEKIQHRLHHSYRWCRLELENRENYTRIWLNVNTWQASSVNLLHWHTDVDMILSDRSKANLTFYKFEQLDKWMKGGLKLDFCFWSETLQINAMYRVLFNRWPEPWLDTPNSYDRIRTNSTIKKAHHVLWNTNLAADHWLFFS